MRPLLSPGDVVLCSALPFRLVRKGDVVVVRPGDGQALVIHRVVRVMPDGRLVTRGDGCPEEDPE
ncbi:MAG: S24/S26 family peptidase, partial [Candidatus Fermentibacter daniensis]